MTRSHERRMGLNALRTTLILNYQLTQYHLLHVEAPYNIAKRILLDWSDDSVVIKDNVPMFKARSGLPKHVDRESKAALHAARKSVIVALPIDN